MHRRIVFIMLLCSMFAVGQQPQQTPQPGVQSSAKFNWTRLKAWVNQNPISKKQSIFLDPGLHHALLSLLGEKDYKRMTGDMKFAPPIQVIGGYLVIRGSGGFVGGDKKEDTYVLLGLNDGSVKVAFVSLQGAVEWSPPSQNEADLPSCILFQIHVESGS